MPYKAKKPCSYPGCIALISSGRFCINHAREDARLYDQQRGTPVERGYGAAWRRLRQVVLQTQPFCVDPYQLHGQNTVKATDVDHILPLSQGGKNELTNLQPLCHKCHSMKTAREDGRWEERETRVGR